MGVLDGKVAIVTGGGRGIGRGHSLLLAQEGAKVVVNDLGGEVDGAGMDQGPAADVVQEIKKAGGEAVASYDSVTDFQGAKNIIDCAINTFGKLDILINNAGILRDRMVFTMSEQEWDDVIAVHLKGTFNCGRWACAYFREQSKAGTLQSGRVINTTSDSGLLGNAGQSNYGAAKAGIASMTVIWAREMQRYGVTCNAIAPGALTRMTEYLLGGLADTDMWAPDSIAPLAVYLASDKAQNITGKVVRMVGGKLELFHGWQIEKSIDLGKKWTVEEVGQRISEFGDLSSLPPIGL